MFKKYGKIIIIITLITILFILLNFAFPDAISSSDDKGRLFYLMTLVAFIGSSLIMRQKSELYKSAKNFIVWIGIFLFLIVIYSFRFEANEIKERIITELLPSKAVINDDKSISYKKSNDGHFHINASINGHKVSFLLDTGASDVILTQNVANRIGIDTEDLKFTNVYNTANGQTYGAPINIPSITIGTITIYNVKASINMSKMSKPLLGMSFLEKLSRYEVRKDTITLWQ